MAPIRDFYEEVLGGPVYLHKRKLLRMTVPGDPSCTGAHYDLTYLRGGTDRVYTSWIPIGDAPAEMGGLVYLEGSDAWGRATEAEYAARSAELPPDERIRAYNKYTAQLGWLTKDLPGLADRLGLRHALAGRRLRGRRHDDPQRVHDPRRDGQRRCRPIACASRPTSATSSSPTRSMAVGGAIGRRMMGCSSYCVLRVA